MDLPETAVTAEVRVTRGGLTESVHLVHVAVVDEGGRMVARAGDPGRVAFYRSAAKPLQALPLVEDGVLERFGLDGEELALCCASHGGEPRHLAVARAILRKVGLDEEALACGPHLPLSIEQAGGLLSRGERPSRVHNNCSGKHAGMLALAAAHGWPPRGYQRADHPVQRRMLSEVSRWTGLAEDAIGTAVDGCGVVCFAVPLFAMALSFARFAGAAGRGEGAAAVVRAMTSHPFLVGGTGRLCTALMESTGERLFVKTGAEGVYCAGVPGLGLGLALKVADGTKRASDVALVRVLEEMGLLEADQLGALQAHRSPTVLNTRGEEVGRIVAGFRLEAGDR